jgi:general secretion pathway protein E
VELLELLVEARLLSSEQAEHVRGIHHSDGRKVRDILLAEQLVEPQELAMVLSLHLRIPSHNLRKEDPEQAAIQLLPEWLARKYHAIPIKVTDASLLMAMADPEDIQAVDELAAMIKKPIEPFLALPQDIDDAINRNYKSGGAVATELLLVPGTAARQAETAATELLATAIAEAPVVRAVDLLLRQAARERASDIHIEPQEYALRVRFRIDGILHEVMNLPMSAHPALLSRIKIISGLNIAESRRPQDGQTIVRDGNKEIDVRVATAPTVYGEMAVLRLLDKGFAFRTLPELGFLPQPLEVYRTLLKLPFGMIVMSGPTGSGKTTTLYASINQLDSVTRNIITIEDPVEYRFANINQMQVNTVAGLSFASGLRACMRLDPNVILVGEIRDTETAQTAIQAALTGHLVFSSVHANDTAGVVFRLIDLGVEPFLVASAVCGVLAQRMVRKICTNCSTMTSVLPEERLSYEKEMGESQTTFLYGAGCTYCAHTGYLGRMGIYEVMPVSEKIRRLILSANSADDIRDQAIQEGMGTLWRDGMTKVKMGLTTPHEVIRNVFTIT